MIVMLVGWLKCYWVRAVACIVYCWSHLSPLCTLWDLETSTVFIHKERIFFNIYFENAGPKIFFNQSLSCRYFAKAQSYDNNINYITVR